MSKLEFTSEFAREYADDKGELCFFVIKMGVVRRSMASRRPLKRFKPSSKRVSRFGKRFAIVNPSRWGPGPAVNGFPETLRTTLRYCDNYTLTSGVGTVSQQIFRMNSCFDPDFTGVGHQPMFYDQLTAVYGRVRVLYSKLSVQFTALTDDTELSTAGPYLVGVVLNSTGTFPTGFSAIEEQNKSNHSITPRDKGASVVTKVLTMSPKRDHGMDPYDDTWSHNVGSNPSATSWACVYAGDLNGTQGSVVAKVTIEYAVEFYFQNNETQS